VKYFLFLILLLPVTAFSQLVDLSLNGGVCFHKISDNGFASNTPRNSFIGTFKAAVKHRKTEVGIGIEEQHITETTFGYTNELAKPLITPYIFINRLVKIPKCYLYAGIMAGLAIANVGEEKINIYKIHTPPSQDMIYQVTTGYTMGVQAGFVYNVVKRLGVGIEAAFRYVDIPAQSPYNYSILSFPITLGVHWRI